MTHSERIEFLKVLPGETISPTQLSKVLGGNPYLYNLAAKDGKLPFAHLWRGRNLRILKQPILDLLSGKETRVA